MSECSFVTAGGGASLVLQPQSPQPLPAPAGLPPVLVDTGARACRGHDESPVAALAVLPSGDFVSVGEDGEVHVHHRDGMRLRSFIDHDEDVLSVAALGGPVVATGGSDGTLFLWDARTGGILFRRKASGRRGRGQLYAVTALETIDPGRFAAAIDTPEPSVEIWAHDGGNRTRVLRTVTNAASQMITALRVDARSECEAYLYVASADKSVSLYDISNPCVTWTNREWNPRFKRSYHQHDGAVRCVSAGRRWAVSGDSRGVAMVFCHRDDHVKKILWDPPLHVSAVTAILVLGDRLISTGADRFLVVSELPSGHVLSRERLSFHPTALAFLPPDRIAVSYANGRINILPLPAFILVPNPAPPSVAPVNNVQMPAPAGHPLRGRGGGDGRGRGRGRGGGGGGGAPGLGETRRFGKIGRQELTSSIKREIRRREVAEKAVEEAEAREASARKEAEMAVVQSEAREAAARKEAEMAVELSEAREAAARKEAERAMEQAKVAADERKKREKVEDALQREVAAREQREREVAEAERQEKAARGKRPRDEAQVVRRGTFSVEDAEKADAVGGADLRKLIVTSRNRRSRFAPKPKDGEKASAVSR